MAEDAVLIEERTADLPTRDRQCVYGYLKIGTRPNTINYGPSVFNDGEPDSDMKSSALGRRKYIDDILIPAKSCESLYRRVEQLLYKGNR